MGKRYYHNLVGLTLCLAHRPVYKHGTFYNSIFYDDMPQGYSKNLDSYRKVNDNDGLTKDYQIKYLRDYLYVHVNKPVNSLSRALELHTWPS